jgi:hypothetical protein
MQAALFLLARAMLNEEAVRCTAHLMRLLQLHGRTKDEREEARSIYLAIIQDHLCKCGRINALCIEVRASFFSNDKAYVSDCIHIRD